MFYLTSDIEIGGVKVKANKVVWKTEVNSFTDTCTISLPRTKYLKSEKLTTEELGEETKPIYSFKEDDKVSVKLGYDGRNELRFMGFVKRVNMGIPVEVECEGYSYQLYGIIFSKTYAKVSVKQLLQDLTAGTDIVLSKEIPDIPLTNVRFKEASGVQVLEWLTKECKLSVYFNFNELYVGTMFGKKQEEIKISLGWNSVKDDGLKKRQVDKNLKIVIKEKNNQGEVKKTKSDEKKYSNEKAIKVKAGIPAEFLKQIAERLQTKENYKGYEGDITIFLEPYATKGMVCEVIDKVFHERQGRYFIDAVDGEFGENGGRQTIKLGFLMQPK